MKIALITVPVMDYINGRLRPIAMDAEKMCPPYGLYLLASILSGCGYEVTLIDLCAQGSLNLRAYEAQISECSLVGIGATSLSWPAASNVIKKIRKLRSDVPIVLGGIHPTMFDSYIIRNFPIQFVIRGEAEKALPELCKIMEINGDLGKVPNLTWRLPSGRVVRNAIGALIPAHELSAFPMPDYSSLRPGVYNALALESSRGCAFDCSYCSTSYRRSWRPMNAERFVDRLEMVLPHLTLTRSGVVNIVDDEFSTDPGRAMEIAGIIRKRGMKVSLNFDSRAKDFLHEGFVESISEYTNRFLVGAECGYDEGLERIGKGINCKHLEDAARVLYKYNLSDRADFSFIIGLPWEGRSEIDRTIKFAIGLHTKYGVRILLQWYMLIPGSRLWDEDYKHQRVNQVMYNDWGLFRNLYLFRTGVHIAPSEVWDIADVVSKITYIAKLCLPDKQGMIGFSFPPSIFTNFPADVLLEQETALANLRKVAKPAKGN